LGSYAKDKRMGWTVGWFDDIRVEGVALNVKVAGCSLFGGLYHRAPFLIFLFSRPLALGAEHLILSSGG